MNSDHMSRLREIILSAMELPEDQRLDFLKWKCAGDQDLFDDAVSLIKEDNSIASVLKTGALDDLLEYLPDRDDRQASLGAIPDEIGGFKVKRVLGEGGMGIVYEAEQHNPRRTVALKVIRGATGSSEHRVKLFQREAAALAQLEHPGIAAIYEAGKTDDGRHFFAMELVRGEPLYKHLTNPPERADINSRLRLFVQICRAVDYAHQQNIIHRDLSPSNIFVQPSETIGGQKESDPQIKILDFGLAKITESDITLTTLTEEAGKIQGTLAYMSPEQARGEPGAIDLRSDVYSLGVVLYEMLTGRRPYHVGRTFIHQALRVICEDEPTRPSDIFPVLRGDLETILLKTLEKDPGRRYQSVSALADDIDRFLSNQPIHARPPTATYQLRKLIARHKWPFGVAAGIVLLLIAFGATMLVMYQNQKSARETAVVEARKAERINEFLQGMLASPNPWAQGKDVTVRTVLDSSATMVHEELKEEPEVRAAVLTTIGNTYTGLGLSDEAEHNLRAGLEIRREVLGERHPDVAASLYHLGVLLRTSGNLEEADSILRESVDIRVEAFGNRSLPVCESQQALATVYGWQGKWNEAEALQRDVLATRKERLGNDHIDVGGSLNDLAVNLWRQQRFTEADSLYEEAIPIFASVYGEEHPDITALTSNRAILLCDLGKPHEAESLNRKALAIKKKILGDEHTEVAVSLANLGVSLEMQVRFEEAEAMYRAAYEILLNEHGEENYRTCVTMSSVAHILYHQGKYEEAEREQRRTLAAWKKIVAEDHPKLNWATQGLALILIEMGRPDEAEPLLRSILAGGDTTLPEDYRRRTGLHSRFGWCLAAQGKQAEADSLFRQVREYVFDIPKAWGRWLLLAGTADIYDSWGMHEEAEFYRAGLPDWMKNK